MGYLQCKKCGGYYELQEGESPDDYDVCSCGGELEYCLSYNDMESDFPTDVEEETKKSSNKTLIIVLLIGGLFLFLIFIILPSLIVYKSYFASDPSTAQNISSSEVTHSVRIFATLFSPYLG